MERVYSYNLQPARGLQLQAPADITSIMSSFSEIQDVLFWLSGYPHCPGTVAVNTSTTMHHSLQNTAINSEFCVASSNRKAADIKQVREIDNVVLQWRRTS